jgi:hypothetical protein
MIPEKSARVEAARSDARLADAPTSELRAVGAAPLRRDNPPVRLRSAQGIA